MESKLTTGIFNQENRARFGFMATLLFGAFALGVTFSFLIAAPMVNEIALGLLYGLLGWKVAAIYAGTGLFIAIFAGWVIGRLKLEAHIEDWVTQANGTAMSMEEEKLSFNDRIIYGWDAVKEMFPFLQKPLSPKEIPCC
jgi:uncharacterized membrane protein YraQ (UPF0718 family)